MGARGSFGHLTKFPGLLGLLLLAGAIAGATPATASVVGPEAACAFSDRYPAQIDVGNLEQVRLLDKLAIDVDGVSMPDGPDRPGLVSAYVNEAERAALQSLGYTVTPVPNLAKEMGEQVRRQWEAEGALEHPQAPKSGYRWDRWYTYDELTAELQAFAAANPGLVQLISIGTTIQGRTQWYVKISDNVTTEEAEPEFKFSSSIHGDEVTGMELTRRMMHYLVDNYGIDPAVTNLVDNAELWFCPMSNPDGTMNNTRYNAHGVDLNRDFPDPLTDPVDSPAGREIEVQNLMNFQYPRNFILGANYHGGELVMNLPWDYTTADPPNNALLWQLGNGYAALNTPLYNNNSPPFVHGVCNGGDWYVIHGGLQDWAYNWRHELHITMEISTTKWPAWSQMDTFWNQNRDSMLWYMNRVISTGIKGIVTDAVTGQPLEADVNVTQVNTIVKSDLQVGDYTRLLMPGTYTLTFTKSGYQTLTQTGVVVVTGQMTVRDAALQPSASYTLTGVVTDAATSAPLAATVEARRQDNGQLIGSTATDPGTGQYSLTLPSAAYDVKAMAAGYVPVTQQVTLTGPAVLDFALSAAGNIVLVVTDGATTRIAGDLATLGYSVVSETAASTTPASWSGYNLLVWSAGANESPVALAAYRDALEAYVAAGGKLVIEGGEIGYDACSSPGYPTFRDNVLHATQWKTDNAGTLSAYTPTHPIATTPNVLGATFALSYAAYGDEDAVVPAATATIVYRTSSPASPVCAGVLAFDNDADPAQGQIVYLTFNYNAISDQAAERLLLQNVVTWLTGTDSTGVPDTGEPAAQLRLAPAPNPLGSRGVMRVVFDLVQTGPVSLAIYDVTGRQVRSLLGGSPYLAGRGRQVTWDGCDARGREVGAGTYWIRLSSGGAVTSRRIAVVR